MEEVREFLTLKQLDRQEIVRELKVHGYHCGARDQICHNCVNALCVAYATPKPSTEDGETAAPVQYSQPTFTQSTGVARTTCAAEMANTTAGSVLLLQNTQ